MKNTIKLFGIIALVAIIVFTMAACSGGGGSVKTPSGTYVDDGYGVVTWNFPGGNKYSTESFGTTVEGTFEMVNKGDKKNPIWLLVTTDSAGNKSELNYALDGDKLTLQGQGFTKK